MFDVSKLHYITQDQIEGHSHASLAKAACEGGVDWVQLRAKNLPYNEWMKEALSTQEVCHQFGAKLIVNDNVELAKEIKADGVHLGKNDMSPIKAREVLGSEYIIGGTANSIEDIVRLDQAKVDYIGIGPFRFTFTKENLSPLIGADGFRKLIAECKSRNINIPLIAIGGIIPQDVSLLMNMGLYGVAISSYINKATDRTAAVKQILNELYSASLKI